MKKTIVILINLLLVACTTNNVPSELIDTFKDAYQNEDVYVAIQNDPYNDIMIKGDIVIREDQKSNCSDDEFDDDLDYYKAYLNEYYEEIGGVLDDLEKTDEAPKGNSIVTIKAGEEPLTLSIYDDGIASLRIDLDHTQNYDIEKEAVEKISDMTFDLREYVTSAPCWVDVDRSMNVDMTIDENGIPNAFYDDDFFFILDRKDIDDVSVRFLGSGYDEIENWPEMTFKNEAIIDVLFDELEGIHYTKTERDLNDLMPRGWFYYGSQDAQMTINLISGYKIIIYDHYITGSNIMIKDDKGNIVMDGDYYGDQDILINTIYYRIASERLYYDGEFHTPLYYEDEDIIVKSEQDATVSKGCIVDFKEHGLKAYYDGQEIETMPEKENDDQKIIEYKDKNDNTYWCYWY